MARCSEYVVTTVQVFTIGGCLLPADIPLWFHYNLSWGIVKGRLCAKVFLLQPFTETQTACLEGFPAPQRYPAAQSRWVRRLNLLDVILAIGGYFRKLLLGVALLSPVVENVQSDLVQCLLMPAVHNSHASFSMLLYRKGVEK